MSAEAPTLRRAGDIILANGLARGEYVDLLAGDPPLPVDKCPVCPRSAIALAVGRDPLFVVDWPMHCDGDPYDEDREGSDAERAARTEILAAEKRFREYLVDELGIDATEDDDDGGVIERWADEPGRTASEVVGAFNASAEYEGRAA